MSSEILMDTLIASAIDNYRNRKWLGLYLAALLAFCGQNVFSASSSFLPLLHALFIKYMAKSNHSYRFGLKGCSLLGNLCIGMWFVQRWVRIQIADNTCLFEFLK